MPFSLIEEGIRDSHGFEVLGLRSMIVVPFFEKALYELSDEEISDPLLVRKLADDIETKICGQLTGRPVLSVPHILSDESSCYYHGYVLAEMSVHQTREYFLNKYGFLADNPAIGPELTKGYWECGNSEKFLDIVQGLTGRALTSAAWVKELSEGVEEKVKGEKEKYEKALERKDEPVDLDAILNMRLKVVDGDVELADSEKDGGIEKASEKFAQYVKEKYYK